MSSCDSDKIKDYISWYVDTITENSLQAECGQNQKPRNAECAIKHHVLFVDHWANRKLQELGEEGKNYNAKNKLSARQSLFVPLPNFNLKFADIGEHLEVIRAKM